MNTASTSKTIKRWQSDKKDGIGETGGAEGGAPDSYAADFTTVLSFTEPPGGPAGCRPVQRHGSIRARERALVQVIELPQSLAVDFRHRHFPFLRLRASALQPEVMATKIGDTSNWYFDHYFFRNA
jgi:hypothetical protein